MKVAKDTVVQFHYVLKDSDGQVLEDSKGGDPLALLVGHNAMIKGVEDALIDKEQGESFSVTVTPENGYGEYLQEAIQRIPAKHLQGASNWKPGMVAVVNTEQGQRQVTVVKVGKFMITVDTNHPLAGQTLEFDIDIVAVREADEQEISHGHAHGVGGHQH
ncbi:FKBP-type peptidyl-prolyl cis-trans isomerase [Thalassotalea mangrovi]|uniref:Peptidyl-prolyl cis-trans isomerase n=1 Tax=Thalassotalea mangrovi TaxID=2572245 RepID=A0A4U1B3L8_9GAMM|nr:peptidylprolyl isomerase [Thalassotalea mangrovi]TKB44541.1 peptidylprolyl isomerase [Thalassotalea mangrovi]